MVQEPRQPLLPLHSVPDSRTTGLMARGDWMLLQSPMQLGSAPVRPALYEVPLRLPKALRERALLQQQVARGLRSALETRRSKWPLTKPAKACLKQPVDRSAGRATLRPTQPTASLTRNGLGAGYYSPVRSEVCSAKKRRALASLNPGFLVTRLLSCLKPRRLPNKSTGTNGKPGCSVHPAGIVKELKPPRSVRPKTLPLSPA